MGNFLVSLTSPRIVRRVRQSRMTYLSYQKLNSFHSVLKGVVTRFPDPLVVEFGVALGGSAAIAIHELERANRGHFTGYDMFGMIPEPSENDLADSHARYQEIRSGASRGLKDDLYYGYEKDLKRKVVNNFSRVGIDTSRPRFDLIEGDFRQSFVESAGGICFMHIDCDWHDSVAFCMEKAAEHVLPCGTVIVDDYNDYGGCRIAVDNFLARNPGVFSVVKTLPHLVMAKR